MARIDDYKRALEIAEEELSRRNPLLVCRLSGASFAEKEGEPDTIELKFLNRIFAITWPDLLFRRDPCGEIPVKQKILMLHYLIGSGQEGLTGELIAFQDVPSAKFYLDAFNKRVKYPLVNTFEKTPEKLFVSAKELFEAVPSSVGDFSVRIQALPKIPITLAIWRGDEEFPSDGAVLFDSSIKNMLSAEDIVELASMVVYPLLSKNR
ncbi:MAG TPA: DUF3786 domain-containing protein [Desulfatiglandales bacterium]|nr:DUF3786 domain-containing protein [Desulfatiglandales bacterium]